MINAQIDIIIPTYNRLWALNRVVDFYLTQECVRQVIVVDDGGSDGTWEWLTLAAKQQPKLLVLRHECNRGASAARNTGADASQAPYVFFADDDMVMTPAEALSQMVLEMEAQNADIAAPVHILPEETFSNQKPKIATSNRIAPPTLFHRWSLELRQRRTVFECTLPHSFFSPLACGLMLVRRVVLQKVRYDEELGSTGYRDETDFQLKALQAGFHLLECTEPIIIDLARVCDNGGCHTSISLLSYEWRACHNNWRILTRHQEVIHGNLGIRAPIFVMQLAFIAKHTIKLIRHCLGLILRRYEILRKGPWS